LGDTFNTENMIDTSAVPSLTADKKECNTFIDGMRIHISVSMSFKKTYKFFDLEAICDLERGGGF
jgi:hypothetical protein